ncbi:MAG: hypothetical protein LBL52_00980 [Rickettsiales bacterium]|jgi:hypothetical protein|nr:hypothetical protein [Rickettsiales bacterium]
MKRHTVIDLDSPEYLLGHHEGSVAEGRAARVKPYSEPVVSDPSRFSDVNYMAGFRDGVSDRRTRIAEAKRPKIRALRKLEPFDQIVEKPKEKRKESDSAAYKRGHRAGSLAETFAERAAEYERPRLRNPEHLRKILPSVRYDYVMDAEYLANNDYWVGFWNGVDDRHKKFVIEDARKHAPARYKVMTKGRGKGLRGYGEARALLDSRYASALSAQMQNI